MSNAKDAWQASLNEAVEACLAADTFAIDYETSSFDPFSGRVIGFSVAVDTELVRSTCPYGCCSPDLMVPKAWYFQFVPELQTHLSNKQAMEAYPEECVPMMDTLRAFRPVRRDPKKKSVYHNCLSAQTPILLSDGSYVSIGELVQRRLPVKVMSWDPQGKKLVAKRVTSWFDNGPKENWLRFRFRHKPKGACLYATPEHEIYVRRPDGGIEKIPADRLVLGDKILQPSLQLSGDQFQMVLGSSLGDGSLTRGPSSTNAHFSVGHGQAQKDYVYWKAALLGDYGTGGVTSAPNNRGFSAPDGVLWSTRSRSHPEVERIREILYPEGVHTKTISPQLLQRLDARGLAVWFMDDGGGTKNTAKMHLYGYDEDSVALLQDWFMRQYSIIAKRRKHEAGPLLGFTGDSLKALRRVIGPYVLPLFDYKMPGHASGSGWLGKPAEELSWSEVISIETLGLQDLPATMRSYPCHRHGFDIEVEGTHNYFAGNTLVSNSKFDLKFEHRAGISVDNQIVDTCVASWLTNENSLTQRLKDLVKKIFGHEMTKFTELGGLFSPDIKNYGADDACQTLRLWRHLEPVLEREGLMKVFLELECALPEILADMELRGVEIDVDLLDNLRGQIAGELEIVEKECFRLAGREFLITSPAEVGKVMFQELQWKQRGKIKLHATTGVPSTARGVLERYEKDKPLASGVLKSRELRKLESTYIDPLIRSAEKMDGRTRTHFNQVPHPRGGGGTVTGRLSSSSDEDLGGCNLQNIPSRSKTGQQIRYAFVASAGHTLVTYDFSQIELRFMAHFSQDKTLLAAYQTWRCGACKKTGRTRLSLHSCPECEAPEFKLLESGRKQKMKMRPDGKPVEGYFCLGLDIHQITADACGVDRRLGKVINFALLYGLGAEGLSRRLKIKVSEARKIHKAYFRKYDGIVAHNNWIVDEVTRYGYVRTILKRRRRFPDKKGKRLNLWDREWRQAANTAIQGSAADLMKVGVRNVYRRLKTEELLEDTGILLQVHDELTVETPEHRGEYMETLVRDELEGAFGISVPIIAEGSRGPSWGSNK